MAVRPPDYKPQIPYGSDHYEGGVCQITSPLLKGQVVRHDLSLAEVRHDLNFESLPGD